MRAERVLEAIIATVVVVVVVGREKQRYNDTRSMPKHPIGSSFGHTNHIISHLQSPAPT